MLQLLGDLAAVVSPLADLLSPITWPIFPPTPTPLPVQTFPPVLTPQPTSTAVPTPAPGDISFLEKFLTGPPMAGVFAVLAAWIAYRGINKTIQQNKETARGVGAQHTEALDRADRRHRTDVALQKSQLADVQARHVAELEAANRRQSDEADRASRKAESDRWWSTLTWAYEKAQESQESSQEDRMDGFRTVAAVAILRSLSSEEQRLDPLQKDAVESIASIFEDSDEPDVRASVDELYKSMGKPSPYAEREHYAWKVGDVLKKIQFVKDMHRDVMTPEGRHVHDWVVETTDGGMVVVECGRNPRPLNLLRSLARTVGKSWPNAAPVPKAVRGGTVSKVLLIYGGAQPRRGFGGAAGIEEPAAEWTGDNFQEEVGMVHWTPEHGEDHLIEKLTEFFKKNDSE